MEQNSPYSSAKKFQRKQTIKWDPHFPSPFKFLEERKTITPKNSWKEIECESRRKIAPLVQVQELRILQK